MDPNIRQVSTNETYILIIDLYNSSALCNIHEKDTEYPKNESGKYKLAEQIFNKVDNYSGLFYIYEDGVILGIAYLVMTSDNRNEIYLQFVCAKSGYGINFIKGLMKLLIEKQPSIEVLYLTAHNAMLNKLYQSLNPSYVIQEHDGNTFYFKLQSKIDNYIESEVTRALYNRIDPKHGMNLSYAKTLDDKYATFETMSPKLSTKLNSLNSSKGTVDTKGAYDFVGTNFNKIRPLN